MIDASLKRIKELFTESEKRNGELSHENFELKKRIAELEEIDIVHCSECIHAKLDWANDEYYCNRHQDVFVKDYYCADGERSNNG